MCRGLPIGNLNRALENKEAYTRVFSGATPADVNYYCVRTLENEKPDICILHVGTNQIGKVDPFAIAADIIKVVKTCQSKGVNKVYISGIIQRSDYPDQVILLNNILRAWQPLHDFTFIFNENLDSSCISYDKKHLNRKGKSRLASNFRRALNKPWA